MKSQAILFADVNKVILDSVEIPEPQAGQLLIKTAFSCVSPGTEIRCLAGLEASAPAFPFIPGYSLTGTVIAAGPHTSTPIGAKVFAKGTQHASIATCWGGHVAHACVEEANCFAIPSGLSLADATLCKLLAIAHRGVRLSRPQPDEVVVVVGLGPIGFSSALLHAATRARVYATDLSPDRVALAKRAGIQAFIPDGQSLSAAFKSHCPTGAHIVVDTTGVPAVLAQAVEMAADKAWDDSPLSGPRIIIQGSYAKDFPLPYNPLFMRECSVHFPRDSQPTDLRAMLDLLSRRPVIASYLGNKTIPFHQAPDTYEELRSAKGARVTAIFAWEYPPETYLSFDDKNRIN